MQSIESFEWPLINFFTILKKELKNVFGHQCIKHKGKFLLCVLTLSESLLLLINEYIGISKIDSLLWIEHLLKFSHLLSGDL